MLTEQSRNWEEPTSDAICVHARNPHYFSYRGEPLVLVTSAEHYGAVINGAFDFESYLDTLQRYGMNYSRIYSGAYSEHTGMFLDENPLAPAEGDSLFPWKRSGDESSPDRERPFDLDAWDERYFQRLHDFLAAADKRDIIIEVCLFNVQYPETWPQCPMQRDNNLQGVGDCGYLDVQGFEDERLLSYQLSYVEKIVTETSRHGNVILEIIDEPTLFGVDSRIICRWIDTIAERMVQTERRLGTRHLIAQQLEVGVDFTDDSRIDVVTTQYAQFAGKQVGGQMALASFYDKNKPIELNETNWLPIWYSGDVVHASRIELWEFMVGGGAGFNQLNGYYTVKNPTGTGEINDRILAQMSLFIGCFHSLDFISMIRDQKSISKMQDHTSHFSLLSEKGRQYLAYFHHSSAYSQTGQYASYCAVPGKYIEHFILDLPVGIYSIEWMDPETASPLQIQNQIWRGGGLEFVSPTYSIDIALKILKAD